MHSLSGQEGELETGEEGLEGGENGKRRAKGEKIVGRGETT